MPSKPTAQKALPTDALSSTSKVLVYADCRETPSQVNNYIEELGALVSCRQLKVADYICSDRVGIERKTVLDFIGSIMNGRLFKQLEELSSSFESPLLIIEGNPERLWTENGLHPNALRGALASVSVDYKVPIIWTANSRETAAQVHWIAHREQVKKGKGISIRGEKRAMGLTAQQEYLVAGLPFVNSKLSRRLLEQFGSVKKVFNAKPERLMKVDKIGEKKARKIFELLNSDYNRED